MIDQPKRPVWRVTPKMRARSRALRRGMTEAETKIWHTIRAHRLLRASFRRQAPIGPYIVDFVCHQSRLIVEVDGGQHFERERLASDVRRDAYLESRGFRVLRFSNLDVLKNRNGVLETIAAAIEENPLPNPPPQAGEGAAKRAIPAAVEHAPSPTLPLKGGGETSLHASTPAFSACAPLPQPSPASGGGSE